MTADEITRVDADKIESWNSFRGLTQAELPERWGQFKKFLHHLDWARPRTQTEPLELTEEIIEFPKGRATEWNPSSFTATGF